MEGTWEGKVVGRGQKKEREGESYVSVFELRTYENKRHNYCKHFYIKYLESPNFIKTNTKMLHHYKYVLVGDFKNPLLHRPSKQKISKETSELKFILNHLDLTDIYRISHSTDKQYALQRFVEPFQKLITLDHESSFTKF